MWIEHPRFRGSNSIQHTAKCMLTLTVRMATTKVNTVKIRSITIGKRTPTGYAIPTNSSTSRLLPKNRWQPEEGVIELSYPDAPLVIAILNIKDVLNMQTIKLLHKVYRVVVVWLIVRRRANEHVETP